jgi:hypothetical protein
MVNYSLIYLFSVLLLMTLAINNYDQILVSLGMQMNEDKGWLKDLELEDSPENRVKVANTLIFVSMIFAPLVLIFLLASKLTDSDNR